MSESKEFIEISKKATEKREQKKVLKRVASVFENALELGKNQFASLELARTRAAYTRWKAIEELDKYLIEFESNFIKRGGKVLWAQNEKEAVSEILSILSKAENKQVVKSKSTVSEEVHLKEVLRKDKIEVLETDLGEFIQDLAGEAPFHIVTPAMHKTKEEISDLLTDHFKIPIDSEPGAIVEIVRSRLRKRFSEAGVGISGANFIISDMGAISISENEGNAALGFSFPKIHIVLTTLEKVLPTVGDTELFWPLLATHATGQHVTAYNHLLFGPRQSDELDGPEEMYVILLDNNRSNLLEQQPQRQAASCIKCGACSNVCPVFQQIGGHAYQSVYNGPIGSIINPHLRSFEDSAHLSYATPLCGKCTEVCPVKIDLQSMFLHNRNQAVEKENLTSKSERWAFYVWKKTMLKRSSMNQGMRTKSFLLETFFKKYWGEKRSFPKLAPKSFNEIWKEENPGL